MAEYTHISWRGVTLNQRTADMIAYVEKRLGKRLQILQGSYHKGVSASAGVHDGGGAVDVNAYSSGLKPDEIVLAMRKAGFAAWHRKTIPGLWGEHIHAVAIGDSEMSPAASLQILEYRAGQNGLANRGPDDGPRVTIRTWEQVKPVTGRRHILRRGSKYRSEVRDVQLALNRKAQTTVVAVDGVFGAEMLVAVKRFNARRKVWPTGVVWRRTLKNLGL